MDDLQVQLEVSSQMLWSEPYVHIHPVVDGFCMG